MRATGVQYERHGIPRVAYASKEIILSAGAFMSPMILMASGIGPKDQLDLLKVCFKPEQSIVLSGSVNNLGRLFQG